MSDKKGGVKKVGDKWEAVCDHGDEQWVIQRNAEHLAVRSLKAHQRECLPHALRTELAEDDDWHPYSVLTRWAQMLSEDYDSTRPEVWTIANAAAFLDRILHRVAHDPEQDFPLFAREIRRCRAHLETVLSDSLAPERGAPCPQCKDRGTFVRLVREYPHWCDDPDCEQQFHFDTDEADIWVCPRDRAHWWTAAGYAEYLDERKGA